MSHTGDKMKNQTNSFCYIPSQSSLWVLSSDLKKSLFFWGSNAEQKQVGFWKPFLLMVTKRKMITDLGMGAYHECNLAAGS